MSAKRPAWLVPIVSIVLLTFVPLPATAGEPAPLLGMSIEERELHEHLENLDRVLRRQVERLRAEDADAGVEESARLEASRLEASRLGEHLRSLKSELRGWDGERAEALRAAVDALGLRAEGVERMAYGARAPSAAADEPAPVPFDPEAVWVGGTGAPSNDVCSAALAIGNGSFTGDTSLATSGGDVGCSFSGYSNDVWFRYTFTADGYVNADTFGSQFDTVLSVHEGCPGSDQNLIACGENADGLQAAVTFFATAGVEYFIRVAGWADSAGPFTLNTGPRGGISGRVTDAATGEPLPFVRLRATGAHAYYGRSGTTDVSGHYTISGLDPGIYNLHVEDSFGHVAELFDDLPCPGGACEPSAGTPVGVSLGLITGGVDFELDLGGTIAGTVSDALTGEPIRYADVVATDLLGAARWYGDTDSDGAYLVQGLPPGTYAVYSITYDSGDQLYDGIPCPGGPPGGCNLAAGTPIVIEGAETVEGIDFTLGLGGVISGTVTDRVMGLPLRWIDVEVFDDDGLRLRRAGTNELGEYRAGGLPAGEYFLRTTNYSAYQDELYDDLPCPRGNYPRCDLLTGTPVAVTSEANTTGIDFALEPQGAVSGKVTDEVSGAPLPSVAIRIMNENGGSVGYASTDSSGEYLEGGLQPGQYYVRTASRDYVNELYDGLPWTHETDPTTGTPVTVALATVAEEIDFSIRRAGSISGTVLGPTGPISGYVEIFDADGDFVQCDYADSQGQYTVPGLTTGTYFALTDMYRYLDELYDDVPCSRGCDVSSGAPIAVSLGVDTGGIDFVLDPGASISGIVTDAETGDPLTGTVRLYDGAGEWVASDYLYSSNGFEFSTLPAGTYYVSAQSYAGHVDQLWDGVPCPEECDPTTGTPIVVSVASVITGIDLALEPLAHGAISGTVIHAHNGMPLRETIVIWDDAGEYVQAAYPDDEGRWSIDLLPPGTYTAGTSSYEFVDELYDGIVCPDSDCPPGAGTPIEVVDGKLTSGVDFALAPRGATCVPTSTSLCLNQGRFRAEVLWTDAQGQTDFGQGVPITGDTGYFWFFDSDNVELVVKVLDACVEPFQRFWVFAGGLTDVRAVLTITDTATGDIEIYDNPLGTPFAPITDTDAFDTCGPGSGSSPETLSAPAPGAAPAPAQKNLNGGRFVVEVGWTDYQGASGIAFGEMLTDDTGYYWFFDPDNVEVVVKVLDACDLEPFNNFWVFAAGLTDVQTYVTVHDTVTGEEKTYNNELGTPFAPIQDVDAFDTCQ
ncbi:MAG: hypothetical protein GY719_40995 [bacterium]|nr:hypothetical protein [bacterium]